MQKYIAKTVIAYTALVTLVVLGLSFFISILGEINEVGTGDYGIFEAILHALLQLPSNFYQFFPMIALLGGVLGLGLLVSHKELIVMRTAGFSLHALLRAVFAGALVLIIIATLCGEIIAPRASFIADKRKESAINSGQAVATATGVWVHEGNNFYHINQVMGKRHLEGVTRYQFDHNYHLLAAFYAPQLYWQNGAWVAASGVMTSFNAEQIVSQTLTPMVWNAVLNANLLTVGLSEPNEMSLGELNRYINHLQQNGVSAIAFKFAYWQRLLQPLATLVMMLLAIPCILSTARTMVLGRRIFLGVILGFIFYIANAFLGQLSVVLQLSPWCAALLPIMLFAAIGYGLLYNKFLVRRLKAR